jgi:hypothetical protein
MSMTDWPEHPPKLAPGQETGCECYATVYGQPAARSCEDHPPDQRLARS